MKIIILAILLSALISNDLPVHYDDEDGHRESWAEWVESSCVNEPRIIMDSTPYCNPNTNKGVTAWVCNDGSDNTYPWSYYTTHWYCPVIEDAISQRQIFLPLISK